MNYNVYDNMSQSEGNVLDHLVYKNPYERFMIMILERLDKVEEALKDVTDKQSMIIGNLHEHPNGYYVYKVVLREMIPIQQYSDIFQVLYTHLSCTQCFISQNTIQAVFFDMTKTKRLDLVLNDFKSYNLNTSQVSINYDIQVNNQQETYMIYRTPTSSVTTLVKLGEIHVDTIK